VELTGTVVPLTNTVFGTVWLDVSELFRSILAAATTGSLPATLGILWFHRCASGTRFIMMFEMGVSSGSNVSCIVQSGLPRICPRPQKSNVMESLRKAKRVRTVRWSHAVRQ